jgi:ubiquinone/menaquinone biosynthesis C-methylase UbiE/DNA-binding MarR family transcriptional regulator
MSAESLQRVFKTLADPTRMRILALLEREELAVQEVMEALGMAQSRVSRHLGILRDAGLLRDRREGTHVFYRVLPPEEPEWRDTWDLARRSFARDPLARRDSRALVRVVEARAARSRSFFDQVGPEWDALRSVFNDDALRARAIAQLVPDHLTVADIGTGTGILAAELARLGLRVIAVDHSPRMLEAARSKLEAAGLNDVELRGGEAQELPLADSEVDAAFAHMVLHYLPSPPDAVREMARVVKPGGSIVVVDFVKHDAEWMRSELGVQWLGFEPSEIEAWCHAAGLERVKSEAFQSLASQRELPATFLARARRPGGKGS